MSRTPLPEQSRLRWVARLAPVGSLVAAAFIACAGHGNPATGDAGGAACDPDDVSDAGPTVPPAPPPAGQAWALDWSDEFNDTAVDTTSPYNERVYGYYEARIRYRMTGPGFWCNFWMRATNGSPSEFDQEVTSDHPNEVWNEFHGAEDAGVFVPANYNCQWHTYAYAWLPGQPVQFYIDGKMTHTRGPAPTLAMYPRLRAGAYGAPLWGGVPDGTTEWPGVAEYDWFRAWKLVPAGQ
jgi:hypothetical protein